MAESSKKRGAYGAGRTTKEAVLSAATELIGTNGYYGSSLRDVAKVVGISHPAVIYHFPTKEALLTATVTRWLDILGVEPSAVSIVDGRLSAEGSPPNIAGMGYCLLRLGSRDDFAALARFDATIAVEAAAADHPLHEYYQSRFDRVRYTIADFIQDFVARELSSPTLSPQVIAEVLVSQWYGSIITADLQGRLDQGEDLVGRILALAVKLSNLSSDGLLTLASEIPEDLAGAFYRALKISRDLTS